MMRVDQLIEHVKNSSKTDLQRREEELKKRRDNVLYRIGEAAKKFLSLRDYNDEDMLERRLREAHVVRISMAEAFAFLAERGDFESQLEWIHVQDMQGTLLWKGYVFKNKTITLRHKELNMDMMITVKKMVEDGYIAILTSSGLQGGDGISIGISKDSKQVAINEAYRGFIISKGLHTSDIPLQFILAQN